MKELQTADEFFAPQSVKQEDATQNQLPSADDFFSAQKPSLAIARNPVSNPAIDDFISKNPAGRIMNAFGTTAKSALIDGGQLGIETGGEVETGLKRFGIFNDYAKGENDVNKAFNEAFIRPAAFAADAAWRATNAVLGGVGEAIQQTSVEVDKLLPEKAQGLLPELTEYFLTTPAGVQIHAIPPDIVQARSVGAIGESEASYFGIKEPTPQQAQARNEAWETYNRSQQEANYRLETYKKATEETPDDIHTLARSIAPETFVKYDALSTQKEAIRSKIDELSKQRDEQFEANPPHAEELQGLNDKIESILGKVNSVEGRLTKKQAANLEDLRSQYDALNEQAGIASKADTEEMAAARKQLQETDYAMRDIAPDISKAYREVEGSLPKEEPVAEVPESANPVAESPAAEQVVAKPIEEQLSAIKQDVTDKLVNAGRSSEEAEAASQLISEHYKAIAEQGWAKGTPEEIYQRDGANIVAGKERAKKGAREFNQPEKTIELKDEGDVSKVRTGEPVTFNFTHNTQSATKLFGKPKKGGLYGREFEPSGRYISIVSEQRAKTAPEGFVSGKITFENPLVVDNNNLNWKKELSEKYQGKTGKELSKAIIKDGYDGVITTEKNHISETVDLTTFDEAKALYQKARGKIRLATEDAKAAITLFKSADASTFIHETGHHWLDEMMRYAKEDDAPASLLKDRDTVNQWLGVKDGEEIARAQHEKFARGFERYLMEGTAPSKELAGVFAKFKKWLTDIYQTVLKLKSPITDDIRHVFDRLLSANPERIVIAPERKVEKTPELSVDKIPDAKAAEVKPAETVSNTPETTKPTTKPKEKVIPPEKAPPSLLEWLSKQGGLVDKGGDLKAMGGNDWHKEAPFRKKLINEKGVHPDDAALKAWEEGYFPEHAERPDINAFFEKVEKELRGDKQYPNNFIAHAAEDPEYLATLVEKASIEESEKLNIEMAEYHEAQYAEFEKQERELEESLGDAWEPEPDNSVTLEDLENERRQENSTRAAQESASGNEQPTSTGEIQEGGSEPVQQLGGDTEPTGRTGEEKPVERPTGPSSELGTPESKFVDKAGNIRLDNLNAPEDIIQVIRDMANENDNFMTARRGQISDGQLLDLADALGMDANSINRRKLGEAFNAEQVVAARKLLIQSAEELRNLGAKAASGTEADLMTYAEARARHMTIQEQVSGITAEAGRALRAFRSLEGGAEAKALGELLKENTGMDLFQLQREAQLMMELDTPQKISRFMNDARKPTFKDMILEYWINSLLSGPITHVKNIIGNTVITLNSVAETAVASGVGKILNSEEAVQFGEAKARFYGIMQGATEGMAAASKILKDENAVYGSHTVENYRVKAIPGKVGEVVRIPTRLLSAEDEMFKAIGYRQELNTIAYRIATKEGLSGEAFSSRMADILQNPTEAIMNDAVKAAEYQTFTNPLGPTGRAIQNFANSHFLAKLVVPFVRTPANILKYAGERTPLGFLSKEIRSNLSGKNGTIARDTQIARMALGTTIGVAAAWQAMQGNLTGGGPSDPKEKALMRMTGWQPYSVKIGNMYYSYEWFDPFATIIGTSADMAEISNRGVQDDEGVEKIAGATAASISKNLVSKLSLRGVSDLLNVVTDPDRYGDKYIQNFASSFIPSFVGTIARTNDPVLREARTTLEAMKARVPGLKEDLFPKRDIWGNLTVSQGSAGPDMLSPIRQSAIDKDPVNQRLLNVGMFPSKLSRKIRGVELTDKQYDDYAKIAGRMAKMRLNNYVKIPGTANLPAEIQRKTMQSIVDNSRESARTIIMMNNPNIYKQAAQNKMSALKKTTPSPRPAS